MIPTSTNTTTLPCPTVAAPSFFPASGAVVQLPLLVAITTTEPNSSIRYTVDGSVPTLASPLYDGLVLYESVDVTLRAIVVSAGCNCGSEVGVATYETASWHFQHECPASEDHVGRWNDWEPNGIPDYRFTLAGLLPDDVAVSSIEVNVLDALGRFQFGWATHTPSHPYSDPAVGWHPYPLRLRTVGGQLANNQYGVSFAALGAAGFQLEMFGDSSGITLNNGHFLQCRVRYGNGEEFIAVTPIDE